MLVKETPGVPVAGGNMKAIKKSTSVTGANNLTYYMKATNETTTS